LLVIVLVAGLAFVADGQRSNAAGPVPVPTVVVNTTVNVGNGVVTPTLDNALGGLRSAVTNLPSFADFQKQNPPSTQPAQAAAPVQAAVPTVASATGLFDPTLGKLVIVDGLSRKLKCEGLESNPDFAGLAEAQKTLAKDICSHL
jgi:hypothetical protein